MENQTRDCTLFRFEGGRPSENAVAITGSFRLPFQAALPFSGRFGSTLGRIAAANAGDDNHHSQARYGGNVFVEYDDGHQDAEHRFQREQQAGEVGGNAAHAFVPQPIAEPAATDAEVEQGDAARPAPVDLIAFGQQQRKRQAQHGGYGQRERGVGRCADVGNQILRRAVMLQNTALPATIIRQPQKLMLPPLCPPAIMMTTPAKAVRPHSQ